MSKTKEITDDHIYLLNAYISALSTEYYLTELKHGIFDVREFKKNNNRTLDYLGGPLYKTFKDTYELDEEFMDKQFELMRTRNKFQSDEFIKAFCNG